MNTSYLELSKSESPYFSINLSSLQSVDKNAIAEYKKIFEDKEFDLKRHLDNQGEFQFFIQNDDSKGFDGINIPISCITICLPIFYILKKLTGKILDEIGKELGIIIIKLVKSMLENNPGENKEPEIYLNFHILYQPQEVRHTLKILFLNIPKDNLNKEIDLKLIINIIDELLKEGNKIDNLLNSYICYDFIEKKIIIYPRDLNS